MTRNWTDYPITGAIPRKKIHITQLHHAYEERIRLIRNDSGRTPANYPLPTWKYHLGDNKAWGIDYPKADPAHWPPNQSPDNEFRVPHIATMRHVYNQLNYTGHEISPSNLEPLSHNAAGAGSPSLQMIYGLNPNNNYLPYGYSYNGVTTDTVIEVALSQSAYTDIDLTNPNMYVNVVHINQLRAVLELFSTAYILPKTIEWQYRIGSASGKASGDIAWDDANTDWENSSWQGWFSGDLANVKCVGEISKAGSNYAAGIATHKVRITFDLDLEISEMGWNVLPPLSAKIISYGRYELDESPSQIIFLKCSTTGASIEIPLFDNYKRTIVDADIKSYIGSGHGNEQFIFTAFDDFSLAERNAHKPTIPTEDGTNTCSSAVRVQRIYDSVFYPDWQSNLLVVITPDWHFGTEEPTTTPAPTTTP